MSRARDFADLAGSASAGGITGRNMVINGGMTIAQRGTSFSSVANVTYTLDRIQWYDTGAGVVDMSQSTETGTHSIALRNSDQSRTRVEEFTVSAANTWEKKTITIPGDTSGTWQATNSAGIQLIFPLAAGSNFHAASTVGSWGTDTNNSGNIYASSNQVNCMDSDANNWYITGIQLEAGQTATPFEHEDFGTTLRKCQRYFNKSYDYATALGTATQIGAVYHRNHTTSTHSNRAVQVSFPVAMRSNPTITLYSLNGTSGSVSNCDTGYTHSSDDAASISGTVGETGFSKLTGIAHDAVVAFHYTADKEF